MWTCGLCGGDNDEDATVCSKCQLRRGADHVGGDTLCVLHSTTANNFAGIEEKGFEISDKPTAGRSLGDVIYGYGYCGGSLKGSVGHAVNACWTRGESHFVIFQVDFNYSLDEVFVFDQPAWDDYIEQNPHLSSYVAMLATHEAHSDIAEEAYRVRDAEVEQLRADRVGAAKRKLERRNRAIDAEIDEVLAGSDNPYTKRMRVAQLSEELSDNTAMIRGEVPIVVHVPSADDIRPDHIAEAACRLGMRAVYMLGTGILTFFHPETLAVVRPWLCAPCPADASGPEVSALLEQADLLGAEYYQQFLATPLSLSGLSMPLSARRALAPPLSMPDFDLSSDQLACSSSMPISLISLDPALVDGLPVIPVADDGHCLFHAVAALVPDTDHLALRQAAATFMADDERAAPLIPVDYDAATYAAALENVEVDVLWGGDPEIQALSLLLQRPIVVHRDGEEPLTFEGIAGGAHYGDALGAPLHLYHTQSGKEGSGGSRNHYDALRS